MRKLTVLSLVAVFVLSLSVPALASVSMTGQVTTRYQSLEADSDPAGVEDDQENGFQDVLANLQIMGDVTAGVNAFAELDISNNDIEVYEAYLTLDDLFTFTDIKLGQFEVNFGSQSARGSRNADVQDNLLIGNPLVMPVATQTGIEFSGLFGKAAWSLSATNGVDGEDFSKDRGTAVAAKVWGELSPVLPGLSGALSYYMVDHEGATADGDNFLNNGLSGAGYNNVSAALPLTDDNPDSDVSAWQIDLAYDLQEIGLPAELALLYGSAEADRVDEWEYDYWSVEGSYDLTPRAYLATRYGVINAENNTGDEDIKRLQVGLGYNLASGVLAKLEYVDQDIGDWADDDGRSFNEFDGVVAEMSVSF